MLSKTMSTEDLQQNFSNLWIDFFWLLGRESNVEIYKRVLIILHERVMPHLTKPLLLTDFLMESYDVGGSISLLALNGVFHLIHKYNLEYLDFYKKLYALFTPDVLHVKYGRGSFTCPTFSSVPPCSLSIWWPPSSSACLD